MKTVLPDYQDLLAIRPLVREAAALGAKFRISGANVEIAERDNLPVSLSKELARYEQRDLLFIYFGGEEEEGAALDLGEQLGVHTC
jgi:hypothetical protein